MSTETQKVDVLEVMDAAAQTCQRYHHRASAENLPKARAAVAELISKADNLATAMSNLIAARTVDGGYEQYVTDLTNALARVGGAA